ncbi:MAG: CBS domain-containing protein [Candidatus Obscuribacterales bacterium]|nr:CBS domain-containing protein [Candidatus Obscuribacterales bacterium]
MDFDCLASQLAVTKLYPAARIVPAHPLSPRIKSFLSLYRDQLPLVDLQYVDKATIQHVFIVDCQNPERLDDRARRFFLDFIEKGSFTVFDHHDNESPGAIGKQPRTDSIVKKAGSAATVLVEILKEREIGLSSFEATVIAAGIYEDTGCLTHRGTTEADALAVAYCLSFGADLERVNEIIRPKFDQAQATLFERLLASVETRQLGNAQVTICSDSTEEYIDGLAEITSRLLENISSDVLVSLVNMKDRIHLVSRSQTSLFDLRNLVRKFGGGGHPGAASAVVKGQDLSTLKEQVWHELSTEQSSELCAREIMATPVRTIKSDTSIDEAGRIMLRYSADGLVVMDDGKVTGIVSNRDVDKARHHKLDHAPVRGFMSHPVITVAPDTPLSKIQSTMIEHGIGRVPVLDEKTDELLGIIGRHELLRALYGDDEPRQLEPGMVQPMKRVADKPELLKRIEPELLSLYKEIGSVAADLKMVAYLVGGCVRDLVLQRDNFDLDFVVEGSAIDLVHELAKRFPDKYELLVEHERFNTGAMNVALSRKREIDIATARVEYYEYPAALPTVEPSSLEQDLFRRDFTINALAMCLHPERFGKIVDYFGGLTDLQGGLIRVLHPFSFIEDPTRIIRAARFASRFNFKLEARTKLQAERAIQFGIFDNLGGVRLKEELRYILESPQRLSALEILDDLGGGLRFLDSAIIYRRNVRLQIRRAEKLLARYDVPRHWIVYLGVLLLSLPEERIAAALSRLHLAEDERSWVLDGAKIVRGLNELEHAAKRSQVYRVLHGHADQALAIAACVAAAGSNLRRWIKIYFEELRELKTEISGHDLLALGIRQGPSIGEILSKLRDAKLDGELRTPEEERGFVIDNFSDRMMPQ